MPIIYPDTSEAIEFGPLPVGVYDATIVSVGSGVSKSGNPKLDVQLSIGRPDGSTAQRTVSLVYTGKGARLFDQMLRSAGFGAEADQFKSGQATPFNTDDLIGQSVRVRIVHRTGDDGVVRDQVDQFVY